MKIEGETKLIAAAFVKARGAMNATVKKDKKGNYGDYATLAAIVEATSEHFSAHGLAIVQEVSTDESGVCIETWLVHESGATMQFTPLVMPLSDRRPQAVGSAVTYGRRYALAAICGLAPDDDDGQAAQDAQPKQQAKKPLPSASADEVFENKRERATKEAVAELKELGMEFYKGEWDEQAPKLAEAVSTGVTNDIHKLMPVEVTKLVNGIKRKMALVNAEVAK